MLEQIANLLVQLVNTTGYLGVFVATVAESFFAPIPSEIILPTAGLAAHDAGGITALLLVCIVAALGNFVGTLPFYLISFFGSKSILPKLINRWGAYLLLSNEDLRKAERLFSKRGEVMVFFSRLIPGIRSLIAFPAGIAKMPFIRYTLFTLFGSFLWNLLLAGVGYVAYDFKDELFSFLQPVEKIVLFIILACVFVYVFKVVSRVRELKGSKSNEISH